MVRKQLIRFGTVFIFLLIIFSLFNQVFFSNVLAEEIKESELDEEPNIGLIGLFIKKFGEFFTIFSPIFNLIVLSTVADPAFIEIGYNETVHIDMGIWDTEKNTEFKKWTSEDPLLFEKRFLDFNVVEYPEGTNEDSWFITFNPFDIVSNLVSLFPSHKVSK